MPRETETGNSCPKQHGWIGPAGTMRMPGSRFVRRKIETLMAKAHNGRLDALAIYRCPVGSYRQGRARMYVSRGIGVSRMPPHPPELPAGSHLLRAASRLTPWAIAILGKKDRMPKTAAGDGGAEMRPYLLGRARRRPARAGEECGVGAAQAGQP